MSRRQKGGEWKRKGDEWKWLRDEEERDGTFAVHGGNLAVVKLRAAVSQNMGNL